MKSCDCKLWRENIDKLNGPAMLAQARNPQYGIWKDLVPFEYCPWCASFLMSHRTAEPHEYDPATTGLCKKC